MSRTRYYIVLLVAAFLSRNLTFPFIFGLLISDLASNNVFTYIQKTRWVNYPLQTFFVIYTLAMASGYLPETGLALDEWYFSVSKTAVSEDFLYLFANRVGLWSREGELVRLSSAICILLLIELNVSLQRFFSSATLRFLGKYSFGFYCLQTFVEASPGIWISQALEGVDVGRDGAFVKGYLTYLGMDGAILLAVLRTADAAEVWAGRFANRVCARVWRFVGGWEIWGRVVLRSVPKYFYQKLPSTTV
jgi:hypothetical protein